MDSFNKCKDYLTKISDNSYANIRHILQAISIYRNNFAMIINKHTNQ